MLAIQLSIFNKGDYFKAIERRTQSEKRSSRYILMILLGRGVNCAFARTFLVSASLQDIIKRHKLNDSVRNLAEKSGDPFK